MKIMLFNILSFALILLSINLSAQRNIIGKYIHEGTGKVLVIENNEKYFLLNGGNKSLAYHVDTLSYGNWNMDESFLVLNVSKSIDSQIVNMQIEEKTTERTDSLVVEIHNPYESLFNHYGGRRIFKYIFSIDSYKGGFGPEVHMEHNRIALPKVEDDKIVNINLYIVPNSYLYSTPLYYNYLVTDNYEFKNINSNHIEIDLPDMTLAYIGYVRFKDEYVRVKRNKLILRGDVYQKVK